MEQHIRLEPCLQTGARLRHTIQAAGILRMNAEELYDYLSQAAEANPMLVLSRDESGFVPLHRPASADQERAADPWDFAPRQGQSLAAHLLQQLPLSDLDDRQERVLRYIIDSLDANGYFTEPPELLTRRFRLEPGEAERCLEQVRSLEPAGVAAAGLQECLLIQLRALPERSPLAELLVAEHWELLSAQPRPRVLAARLGRTPEELRGALALIGGLNPRPSNGFSGKEPTVYVTPDAYLTRQGDALRVLPVACGSLTLDSYYQSLRTETEDKEVRQYLAQCARQADDLLQSLRQREALLLRILTYAVQIQRAFFDGGPKVPLQQLDVAEALGLNASTVSRAVQNKYLHYWGGLLPMRELFSRPVSRGGGVSVHTAMEELKRLVAGENRSAPYSDRILCQLLEERGISLSRRRLTNYREQLGIPPAYLRREPPR